MKFLWYFAGIFSLTGCNTWLRYNHEIAMTFIPANTQTVFTNNDYIRFYFTNDMNKINYRAYYTPDGMIYKTIKNKP